MKAVLEKPPQRLGSSFRYRKILEQEKQFNWHYHQHEFELVLHRNFEGNAYIGHYQGEISHNSLMLIAPRIPHAYDFKKYQTSKECETHVFWFKSSWLIDVMNNCIELNKIESLLKRAEKGILFSPAVAEHVFNKVNNFFELTPIGQLSLLFQILSALCEDKSSQSLLSYFPSDHNLNQNHIAKVEKLCGYIEANYNKPITLQSLSSYMSMSESSIYRLFEQHFNESFSQYLKKIRLNHSAELLISTNFPIAIISEKVGYKNQANFNKQFKQYKKCTPKEFRNHYKLCPKV